MSMGLARLAGRALAGFGCPEIVATGGGVGLGGGGAITGVTTGSVALAGGDFCVVSWGAAIFASGTTTAGCRDEKPR